MTMNLFDDPVSTNREKEQLEGGAFLLRGFALSEESGVLRGVQEVTAVSPFRHMITPGGYRMSVAMTNCGSLGWVSDRSGYRYDSRDPETGQPWPAMPAVLLRLAQAAAKEAGFPDFLPDACLINRYEAGAKLALHQDKDERNFAAPIVSVSLGIPATFLFGGVQRADTTLRVPLVHGDVVVWGGPARLRYHGVLPLKPGNHPAFGAHRVNLTFRKAG